MNDMYGYFLRIETSFLKWLSSFLKKGWRRLALDIYLKCQWQVGMGDIAFWPIETENESVAVNKNFGFVIPP